MLRGRQSLPAYQRRTEIVKAIADKQVVIISGATGCGKSTQVPQLLLDSMLEDGFVGCAFVMKALPMQISAPHVATMDVLMLLDCFGPAGLGPKPRLCALSQGALRQLALQNVSLPNELSAVVKQSGTRFGSKVNVVPQRDCFSVQLGSCCEHLKEMGTFSTLRMVQV